MTDFILAYGALAGKVKKVSQTVNGLEAVIENLPPVFTYKGVVTNVSDLPSSGQEAGDMYIVSSEGNAEYFWSGTAWINTGGSITNEQIDSLYN